MSSFEDAVLFVFNVFFVLELVRTVCSCESKDVVNAVVGGELFVIVVAGEFWRRGSLGDTESCYYNIK